LSVAVLVELEENRLVTDRQTDRPTDAHGTATLAREHDVAR